MMAAMNDFIIQKDKAGIAQDAVSIVIPDATVYVPLEELIRSFLAFQYSFTSSIFIFFSL